jgi:hypothetical protein
VSGFPTLKFFPIRAIKPEKITKVEENDFVAFINKKLRMLALFCSERINP